MDSESQAHTYNPSGPRLTAESRVNGHRRPPGRTRPVGKLWLGRPILFLKHLFGELNILYFAAESDNILAAVILKSQALHGDLTLLVRLLCCILRRPEF